MSTKVRTCPKCFRLMWIRDEEIEYLDENAFRVKCPHCQESVRFTLVTEGSVSAGPKMGH